MGIQEEIIDKYKKSLTEFVSVRLSFLGLLIASSIWLASIEQTRILVKVLAISSTIFLLVSSTYLIKIPDSFLNIYDYLRKLANKDQLSEKDHEKGLKIANYNYEINKSSVLIVKIFTILGLTFLFASIFLYSLQLIEINIV